MITLFAYKKRPWPCYSLLLFKKESFGNMLCSSFLLPCFLEDLSYKVILLHKNMFTLNAIFQYLMLSF